MSKIKKFFSKKREEAAFKLKLSSGLGQGHTLSDQNAAASSSFQKPIANAYVPPKRKELSDEVRSAANAALERVGKNNSKEFSTSLAYIKSEAKKELEAERRIKNEMLSSESTIENNPNTNLACEGVFFRCPIISEEVLSKKDWINKIKIFLYQQLETERALTSCLIIHNCNSKDKAEVCINTLKKYLENIIKFPEDDKYFKIRMLNRVFCEKVRYVEGALDFLHAAGFREVDLDNEKFLIWSSEYVEKDYDLSTLLEALQNSEKFQLVLDRNIKVLLYSQAKHVILPDDFYRISPEEIKREQQLRGEVVEKNLALKTKAMREREDQRTIRKYKYSLVRVKFPNGLFLQGTFSVYEKLTDILEFVQSCLQDEAVEFQLVPSGGGKFTEEDMDKSLYDLRLVPNIVLLFIVRNETTVLNPDKNFIKEELLLLVQSI